MTVLRLEKVSKIFSEPEKIIIDNISFRLRKEEFVSVVGKSGTGKTTLLRLVAGLEEPTDGTILLNKKHSIEMVFQSYSVFPFLSVQKNIGFGLELKKEKTEKIDSLVSELISLVELKGFESFFPKNLSGGMQQRVAIASALATSPEILLMDEPFGALDYQTRLKMQDLLINVWKKKKASVLFVTHDIEEALYLSDRIFVIKDKKLTEINVSFKRPRVQKLKDRKEFIKMKRKIQEILG